ncbi:hypothetical protein [Ramlibacter humi]|uniref:DUF481 domain-containing protein n=1 Tax=Ramlibacter humi TaxID=2530451 RepID=A0A4Z0BDR2_9BURK|nr:hypothetical protein [Ramlibacter humi]TFY96613.1 hypothetical protein EZ216_20395 [Ramlibacter humi]
MPASRITVAVLLACASAGTWAQPSPWSYEVTGSVLHRRLVERTATGGTLLTETGPLARVQLQATHPLPGDGAFAVRGELAGGDLDYDGRTQAGAPLRTTTRHVEGGASFLVRPHAPAPWGELWAGAGWQRQYRGIRGTAVAGGLAETADAVWLVLRWRSPEWQGPAGWWIRAEPEVRASLAHNLKVDFHGVLDTTSLEAGQQRAIVLRLVATAPDSPWSWGLEWRRLSQAASLPVPVSLRGVPVPGTTLFQPKLSTRDLGLTLTRRF